MSAPVICPHCKSADLEPPKKLRDGTRDMLYRRCKKCGYGWSTPARAAAAAPKPEKVEKVEAVVPPGVEIEYEPEPDDPPPIRKKVR